MTKLDLLSIRCYPPLFHPYWTIADFKSYLVLLHREHYVKLQLRYMAGQHGMRVSCECEGCHFQMITLFAPFDRSPNHATTLAMTSGGTCRHQKNIFYPFGRSVRPNARHAPNWAFQNPVVQISVRAPKHTLNAQVSSERPLSNLLPNALR